MPKKRVTGLAAECGLLHNYLVGREPSAYVIEKYCMAHSCVAALEAPPAGRFDAFLIRASFRHALLLRLVQAYARIFAPAALARKKAVLMLAIVECCAPAHAVAQRARAQAPFAAVVGAGFVTLLFGLELALATVFFAPVQLVLATATRLQRAPLAADLAVHEVA